MSDLISRQAAIDAADRADYTGLTVEDVKKVTDEVVKELKQLPSADRRTGEWIKSKFQNEEDVQNDNYLYNCSECGHGDLHARTQEVPYCWWCGSLMKGADDEEST